MTRKDYILLAEVFRVEYHRAEILKDEIGKLKMTTIESVASEIADSLRHDNSRFNYNHFLAVVRGEKDLHSRPSRNGVQS